MDSSHQHLEDYVAFRVHRLSAQVLRRFEKSLLQHGVTHAQWLVLFVLHQKLANVPRAIAEEVGIDAGAISRVIDRLVLKRFVSKHPNLDDKRSITLKLTVAGEALMVKLVEIANQQEAAWLTPISQKERMQFEAALNKLLAG